MVAWLPWQLGSEGGEEVEEGPSDDDVVVERNEEGDHEHADPNALEKRHRLPDSDGTLLPILAEAQLKEEERQPRDAKHGEVGDQESTWNATDSVREVNELASKSLSPGHFALGEFTPCLHLTFIIADLVYPNWKYIQFEMTLCFAKPNKRAHLPPPFR